MQKLIEYMLGAYQLLVGVPEIMRSVSYTAGAKN